MSEQKPPAAKTSAQLPQVEPKLKQMSSLQLTEGKKAVLKCEVVAGNPVTKIKWYKNDKELKGKNKPKGIKIRKKKQGKILELVIMKVTEADTGAYKCEVINHLGKSSSSANLTISAATSTTPSAKTSSHVTRCGESERNYCVNGGECFTLEVTAGNVRRLCRCLPGYTGNRCQSTDPVRVVDPKQHLGIEFMEAEELYQKRVLTITGICIALLVVGIMCVVAYCKTKKQRKKLHDRLRQNLRERNVAAKASVQTPQEHLQLHSHCPKDAVPLEKEAETALSSSPTCPTAAITPSNSQCWRAGKAEAHCPETHVVVVKPVAAGHRTRLNGTGGAHRVRDPAEPVHTLSFAPRVATPPLTPSSPPSESSAPLSSLATSVLSEAVSPSGEEERPLLIQTPVLRAKPGSNQGQKSERSLHLRNSAHYNHGLDAPTPPASPEPAEESGNLSIPPAGQAEPSSESSSSESEEDEDTPFLVLQNPLLASSGSVVLDGLEGRTNPTRSRLNPVMAAADPIAV